MSYFNPWAAYGGQQQQSDPWAGYTGKQQPIYTPINETRPETQEQRDEYRRLQRRNSLLVIVLVVLVILLIGALIAVFLLAFLPSAFTAITSTTTTSTTTATPAASLNINLDVTNPNVNYGTEYDASTKIAFTLLAATTCDTLKTVAAAKSYTITSCTTSTMSSPGASGILMKMVITVLNNGKTDTETLVGVGTVLISDSAPLIIPIASIAAA